MDTRPCYVMETGFTSSDFSFYKKHKESIEVDRAVIYDLQSRAGKEKWYQVDSYVHYWKSGHGSDRVIVLVNDNHIQIETCSFGWKRVQTEHEKLIQERDIYQEFIGAIASIRAPASLRRWHAEIIEAFEHEFEETLYYGEEDA